MLLYYKAVVALSAQVKKLTNNRFCAIAYYLATIALSLDQ